MAPYGWQRQTRWNQRDWMKLIFETIKKGVEGRKRRQYALRCIGQVLMRVYKDEEGYMELVERREKERSERKERLVSARRRVRRQLWMIFRVKREEADAIRIPRRQWVVGGIERWVDSVHEEPMDEGRVQNRIVHAMQCVVAYICMVFRPAAREQKAEQLQVKQRRHNAWLKWSRVWTLYKQQRQQAMLDARAKARAGLVCAQTRNVGRLGPKGGISYDETKRYRARIEETALYKTHRWPRRDKCGPTLVGLLYNMWDIT